MAIPTHLQPWMKILVARVSGATESIIQDELVQVISDFCREAMPWRFRITGLNIVAGEADIAINPVDNRTTCTDVLKVFYNGQEIGQAAYDVPGYEAGTPVGFTCALAPDVITLIPVPTTAEVGAISALVSLAPKNPAVWIPPFFETHHFQAILDGTLGQFYNQPLKPYSDEKKARYHLYRYRSKINEARDMANRGYTPGAQNWAYPRFGI